jgi:hypothetical protein
MSTLYELTEDYMNLLALAEDPDIDEQAFMDTLDGIEGAIEVKADGYAKVMRQLEADAAACDAESKRLKNKSKTIDNNIKRMKTALQYAMQATGKTKFKTALFSFGIQKNPASVVMDEQYIENIPERFLVRKDPEINRKAIRDAINAGEDLEGLAHLEQTESLRIK